MKRILTVQDFSCVGKCSLTVAMPIVSAFAIETAAIPTAMLSNHTAFSGWTFKNLSDQIEPIANQWEKENIDFDGFYAGYLGSIEIIDSVKMLIDKFCKNGAPVLIDPAMGDNGKLYAGFDMNYVLATKDLCAKADVVTPNITEACFMLGMEYKNEYDKSYLNEICQKLKEVGSKNVIITGVVKDGKIGAYCSLADGSIYEYYTDRERQDFHGTGDIYSSAVFGGIMCGKSICESARFACDFTKECIAVTLKEPNHVSYGVNFEQVLYKIYEFIK